MAAAPDAPYADLAWAGVQKILDVLDPQTRGRAQQLADRVWVDRAPSSNRVIRSALEEAMTEQRVIRIDYTAGDAARTTREVEPVLFASTSGHWYLVGWCRLRDEMRWFALERIHNAAVTSIPCTGHSISEIGSPPRHRKARTRPERVNDLSTSRTEHFIRYCRFGTRESEF